MLEQNARHPEMESRRRMAISSKERRALLDACENFEESLKRFIRNPKAGDVAQVAAQCLFEVRKLENALCHGSNRDGFSVKIDSPANPEDL
jgi:hypothetical protein